MNKYLKGCLVLLGIGLVLIAGIVGWYYWWKASNQRKADTDRIRFSAVCDNLRIVTDKPTITLTGFDTVEINRLRFYLIRGGSVIQDTIVAQKLSPPYDFTNTQIPFEKFLKTDTVIVQTKGKHKLFYRISGFQYYADLHYGMMGYLGSYDCRFDNESLIINGKQNNSTLLKQNGLKENIVPR